MNIKEISKAAHELAIANVKAVRGDRPAVDKIGLVGAGGVSRGIASLGTLSAALAWDRAVRAEYEANLANNGLRVLDFKVVAK